MVTCRSALVLTAGLGTRLWPLTNVRAKAAVPIGSDALIQRIVKRLVSHGIVDVVLNLHHLPETITGILGDGSDLGARLRYSWEQPRVLGPAGGIRQALPIVGDGTFLVLNGDTLTDVDVAGLLAAHTASRALVTMALVPPASGYGGVRLDEEHRVVGFTRAGQAADAYHFVGAQIVESSAFSGLPAGEPALSVGGLFDELIREHPGSIRGFVSDAAFWDVGTVADYWSTSWAFSEREGRYDLVAGRRVRIASSARVSRSILWNDVEVAHDAVLHGCLVTDGASVPAGSHYRDAILTRADDGTLQAFPRTTR